MVSIKKVQIKQHGGPEVIEFIEDQLEAPADDEVQIEHKALGLNFIDIYFRTGLYEAPLPHGLGFEGAGIVTAVGKNVEHVRKGDRVAYAQSPIGAYATARNMPAFQVIKLPDSISFEEAAAVMLKGLTAQYLLRQTYPVKGGETILYHAAAGGVGTIACQWAKALGVNVIGTVSSEEKAQQAKQNGVWEVINYTEEDVVQRVLELTEGNKVPVVYDSVGKDTWETSLDCLQPLGTMVSFGNASGAVTGVNLGILAAKGSLFVTRPILGTYVATQEKLQKAADELFYMIEHGHIKVHIGQTYKFEEVAQAQIDLAERKTVNSTVLIFE